MRKLSLFGVAAVAAACSDPSSPAGTSEALHPSSTVAFAKPDRPSAAAVVSEFLGGGAAPNLSIQSDQGGPYVNKSQGVVSLLQAVGDWVVELDGRRSTRQAHIDLGDPLAGNPASAPFASALVKPRFIAKSTQVTPGGIAAMTGLGSTISTPLSAAFSHGDKDYAIRMNPGNHPATEFATVTCTAVADANSPATSQCSQWRMVPSGNHDGATKNVGRLEELTSSGPVFLGYYYFSFEILITR